MTGVAFSMDRCYLVCEAMLQRFHRFSGRCQRGGWLPPLAVRDSGPVTEW